MAIVRYGESINICTPFEVGLKHFKVGFSSGTPDKLQELAKNNIIDEPLDGNDFSSLTIGQRFKHIVAGIFETVGYLTLILPFITCIIDRTINAHKSQTIESSDSLSINKEGGVKFYQTSSNVYTLVVPIRIKAFEKKELLSDQSMQNLNDPTFISFLKKQAEASCDEVNKLFGTKELPCIMLEVQTSDQESPDYFHLLYAEEKESIEENWQIWPALTEGQFIIKNSPTSEDYFTQYMVDGTPHSIKWTKTKDFFATNLRKLEPISN